MQIEIDDQLLTIHVTHYYRQQPSQRDTASDWDNQGYVDFEFYALDEDGHLVDVDEEHWHTVLKQYEESDNE